MEIRIGVNTGEVVVRSITTGGGQPSTRPSGTPTNLASRMQTGRHRVDRDQRNTRKLVEGYFQLKPLGPTKVKGVSEPVNVYEVTGLGPLRTRLQRAAGRGLTSFVGREREIETLKHAADQAKAGHGTDRSGDGGAGFWQVAAVFRVQGDFAIGLDGAGDVFDFPWQSNRRTCR